GAVAIHFAHRVVALVVTLAVFTTAAYVQSVARSRRELTRPALVNAALVAVQVTLGALTVLSRRDPWINSFHVVVGALVLTASLVLTLRTWRSRFVGAAAWDDLTAVPYVSRRAGTIVGPGLQPGPNKAEA